MSNDKDLNTTTDAVAATTTAEQAEVALAVPKDDELKLSELLILASLWMLFGFMLWFYLSAFHGAPVRIAADAILRHVLDSDFHLLFYLLKPAIAGLNFRSGKSDLDLLVPQQKSNL